MNSVPRTFLIICALAWLQAPPVMAQEQSASLRVQVLAANQPVEKSPASRTIPTRPAP
jgi:hypothetical protein